MYNTTITVFYFDFQLLERLSGVSEEYQSVVYDVLSSRDKDIRAQLLSDTHAISHASMTDFDWTLKVGFIACYMNYNLSHCESSVGINSSWMLILVFQLTKNGKNKNKCF